MHKTDKLAPLPEPYTEGSLRRLPVWAQRYIHQLRSENARLAREAFDQHPEPPDEDERPRAGSLFVSQVCDVRADKPRYFVPQGFELRALAAGAHKSDTGMRIYWEWDGIFGPRKRPRLVLNNPFGPITMAATSTNHIMVWGPDRTEWEESARRWDEEQQLPWKDKRRKR